MEHWNFELWCKNATKLIRYKPDRKAVSKELMAHLEEAYDACVAQGHSHAEAERMALTRIGSAEEIAPQLARIYSPWLGYMYSLVKAAALCAAVLALYCMLTAFGSGLHTLISSRSFDFIPANYDRVNDYCHPNVSDSTDGCHLQVTEAGYSKRDSTLYFELEILYWPWLEPPQFVDHIWAIDSTGRLFSPAADPDRYGFGWVQRGGSTASSCIQVYEMSLTLVSPMAEWVELHYDRDGRDIVLRIDLMGGNENE